MSNRPRQLTTIRSRGIPFIRMPVKMYNEYIERKFPMLAVHQKMMRHIMKGNQDEASI